MMAHYSSLALLIIIMLCLCGVSLTLSESNGFSVELIHRDSSKSPFYRPQETHFQRVSNAMRRSFNRVNRCFNSPQSNVTPNDAAYVMRYSVGTPPFPLYGAFDTGSDIIWLQCKPCKWCYNQTTPIFDPSKSKTYKTLPCSSTMCQSVQYETCSSSSSSSNTCGYRIQYGDMSKSEGEVSVDTLTLDSTSGSPISFPRTVIGCGHENILSLQGITSGIVGLGGGPVSLTTQLGPSIKGKFSYCLVPMFSRSNSKLNFGDAAVVSGYGTVSTPIISNPDQNGIFYTIALEAFSVGNKRLDFNSSTVGAGKTIIDSGSTLTFLPSDVYKKLESAVANLVKLKRVEDPNKQLSLCYLGSLDSLKVPVITVHFKGGDALAHLRLNAFNTFLQVSDRVVCFAFASSESIGHTTIFGNVAQHNFLVGFDLQNKIVSFKPTNCTKE